MVLQVSGNSPFLPIRSLGARILFIYIYIHSIYIYTVYTHLYVYIYIHINIYPGSKDILAVRRYIRHGFHRPWPLPPPPESWRWRSASQTSSMTTGIGKNRCKAPYNNHITYMPMVSGRCSMFGGGIIYIYCLCSPCGHIMCICIYIYRSFNILI
jgi:hypothetical protein